MLSPSETRPTSIQRRSQSSIVMHEATGGLQRLHCIGPPLPHQVALRPWRCNWLVVSATPHFHCSWGSLPAYQPADEVQVWPSVPRPPHPAVPRLAVALPGTAPLFVKSTLSTVIFLLGIPPCRVHPLRLYDAFEPARKKILGPGKRDWILLQLLRVKWYRADWCAACQPSLAAALVSATRIVPSVVQKQTRNPTTFSMFRR